MLTFAIRDSALRKIVRCQLYRNAVPWYDSDVVLPHLTGDVSYDLMAILELYLELCSRQGFYDRTCKLYYFLVFGHKL